jgi:hypothetical protein
MMVMKCSQYDDCDDMLVNNFLSNDLRRRKWVKVKVKFSLERAMKAQRGSRGIALLFK